jgi:hypothetical protein
MNWFRPCCDQQLVKMDVLRAIGAHEPVCRIDGNRESTKHQLDRVVLVVSLAVDQNPLFWLRTQ